MRLGDRKERERYMDSLEWQMQNRREQIERTLDQVMEDSDQRPALEKIWGFLPSLSSRPSIWGTGERERSTEPGHSETPSSRGERVREPSRHRFMWRRIFGR